MQVLFWCQLLFVCIRKSKGEAPEVHVFYYLWYDSPQREGGSYVHWDHTVLPHWDPMVRERYKATENKRHNPPNDLHSVFYPWLKPYSSFDERTLDQHFRWMKEYEIDVAVLSWTGRGEFSSDTQGSRTDEVFPFALSAARRHGIKVAVHLEPYEGRSPYTIIEDLKYLKQKYGDALIYKDKKPLVYIYDAYHSSPDDWFQVLCPEGNSTIRNDPMSEVIAFTTILQRQELNRLAQCFDGVYTYFATDGFTYGSSARNWPELKQYATTQSKLLSLSLGPGYNDTRIRPWNQQATRDRRFGAYFRNQLEQAIANNPDIISITSFNEWGEGTQIEPAQPFPGHMDGYLSSPASDHNPFLYLELLRDAKHAWQQKRLSLSDHTLRDEI